MYLALQECPHDFVVIDGVRTPEEQEEMLRSGASFTKNSRHLLRQPINLNHKYSHAVDIACLVNGKVRWELELYKANADVIVTLGRKHGIAIDWGGNWIKPVDGPHFQLSWAEYPITGL